METKLFFGHIVSQNESTYSKSIDVLKRRDEHHTDSSKALPFISDLLHIFDLII